MNAPTLPLRGSALTRRRLMQGTAAAGAVSAVRWPRGRALAAPSRTPVLSGSEFQLEIGPTPINITGQPRIATAVNGQVPGPILRWREGDTVTLAVSNRLSVPSSIHWHGIRAPSPMDGVPGLSFNGMAPGRDLYLPVPGASERHLLVPQPFGVPGADRG